MKITQVLKILIIFLVMSAPIKVNASCPGCELSCLSEETIRLQRIARNITTSYTYEETFDKDGFGSVRFTVRLNNVHRHLEIEDSNKRRYGGSSNNQVELRNQTSGSKRLRIFANTRTCSRQILELDINLPSYNRYYKKEPCDKIPEFTLCRKWSNVSGISYSDFQKRTQEYMNIEEPKEIEKEKEDNWFDDVMSFISEYRYYIGAGMIAVTILVIIITNRVKKKDDFDLNTN